MKLFISRLEWDAKIIPAIKFCKAIKDGNAKKQIKFRINGDVLTILATDGYIAYRSRINGITIESEQPLTEEITFQLILDSVKTFTKGIATITLEIMDESVMIYDDFKSVIYSINKSDLLFKDIDEIIDNRKHFDSNMAAPEVKMSPCVLKSVAELLGEHSFFTIEMPTEVGYPMYAYIENQEVLFMPIHLRTK